MGSDNKPEGCRNREGVMSLTDTMCTGGFLVRSVATKRKRVLDLNQRKEKAQVDALPAVV